MRGLTTSATITLEGAQSALDAALDHARGLGVAVCGAVVDRGGELIAYVRMEGAALASSAVSQDKAWTAVAFGASTADLWKAVEGAPDQMHTVTNTSRVIVVGGGIPLDSDGEVVGAIGISGGTPEQDDQIARAGVGTLG